MWIIITALFFTISYFDTKELREKKEIKLIIIYALMMTLSCIIGILISADVNIPSPATYIGRLIKLVLGK